MCNELRLAPHTVQSLAAHLSQGGRHRLSVREGDRWILSSEADDLLAALAALDEQPAQAEARVEAADAAGEFATLIPYFRLRVADIENPIRLTAPADPRGLPVRLMVYDEAERAYIADFAQFGGEFHLDPATLPLERLLRTRFYLWNSAKRAWLPTGYSRRLPGSGKLGRPAVQPRHAQRAAEMVARVRELTGTAEGSSGLIELFDDVDFLADIPAGAADAEVAAELASLLAGAAELSLRVRTIRYGPDDSKQPGPLETISDIKPAFDALLGLLKGDDSAEAEARRLLDLTAADDGAALASIVSGYLFKFLPEGIGVGPQDWRLAPIDGLCADWDRLENGSVLVGELLTYIWLYALMQRHAAATRQTFGKFFNPGHLVDGIEPVLDQMRALPARRADFYSARMYRAKLESLRDRDRAAALFEHGLASPSPIRPAATFDGGADTYFSNARLEAAAPVIDARRADLAAGLEVLRAPPADRPEPVFLFSTDPRFLAIYLPAWLAQAEYCKARNIDFHFIVIGEGQAVAEALARTETLRCALADLRGYDRTTYADNVTFSTWSVPDWCREPITFYACARYLAIGELSRRFGRDILIQDMDFTLLEDPKTFLGLFPQTRFGIQGSHGLYGLDAWRRFMGGTFFAPDCDTARARLRELEAYLIEGLAQKRSWYLDQNALTYFFERVGQQDREGFFSLNVLRPTQQPRINQLFEAEQP